MSVQRKVGAHLASFVANAMWGVMAPVSKILFSCGAVTATALADLRLIFGTLLFWSVSLFVKDKEIDKKDYWKLIAAALFSTTLTQILFVNGVALTSPVDAGICTSTLPIWTLIFGTLFKNEKFSTEHAIGVLIGLIGFLVLVLYGAGSPSGSQSNIWGDLMCLGSQISYAIYLVFYQDIIKKYSPLTLMKWKYLFGAAMLLPLSMKSVSEIDYGGFGTGNWMALTYILLCGTFFSYLIVPIGQKTLKPTVVAMYSYLQPICATLFAVFHAQDKLTPIKILAICLISTGVMLVNKRR